MFGTFVTITEKNAVQRSTVPVYLRSERRLKAYAVDVPQTVGQVKRTS